MNAKMLVGVVALLVAASVRAEVVSTGGNAVQIAPPASVDVNVLESNTQIRAFDEQQAVTLAAPLAVNISAPGVYDDPADLTPATIPAGSVISSHLVHFDITRGRRSARREPTFRDRSSASSTMPTTPLTTYPPAGIQFRGAELDENDLVEVGCDFIRVELESFQILDHVRVITAHDDPCGQACSPGYWKHCDGNDAKARRRIAQFLAAGYSPTAKLNATFGTTFFPNATLCEGANLNGGGVRSLARHAVAALLSASHPDIDYPLTPEKVIALVRAGKAGTISDSASFLPIETSGRPEVRHLPARRPHRFGFGARRRSPRVPEPGAAPDSASTRSVWRRSSFSAASFA
jgi:hypothetical protein